MDIFTDEDEPDNVYDDTDSDIKPCAITKLQLTYEEIGKRVGLSPQQIHKIDKIAVAKLVYRLHEKDGGTWFDAATAVMVGLQIAPHKFWQGLPNSLRMVIEQELEMMSFRKHIDDSEEV